jgi:hypothetical protein
MTSREKLVKIGARIVRHGRYLLSRGGGRGSLSDEILLPDWPEGLRIPPMASWAGWSARRLASCCEPTHDFRLEAGKWGNPGSGNPRRNREGESLTQPLE